VSTPAATREAPERRDLEARSARDRLAMMMGVHPRELGVLDAQLAATMATHLTDMNRRVQRLVDSNAFDELTGALRRQPGLQALEREIDRCRRSPESKLVVAFIDVDDLKHLNDSEGHAAGDRLLKDVAATLRGQLRSYDLVIRWGGDEFVCVLPEAGLDGASRIVEDIAVSFAVRNGLGFSTGLAALEDTDSAEDLISRADKQLYATRRGKRPYTAPASPREAFGAAVGAAMVLVTALLLSFVAFSGSARSFLQAVWTNLFGGR
jgi:diguanylate cyclase (GGDEF)-like protein